MLRGADDHTAGRRLEGDHDLRVAAVGGGSAEALGLTDRIAADAGMTIEHASIAADDLARGNRFRL